jgi:hypothetical protein
MIAHPGGCHCGRARFEVIAPAVLQGAEVLTSYQFNTRTARHMFCSVCGLKSFYVPRSHPDGFSVNARCLDDGTVEKLVVTAADGREWKRMYPQGRSPRLDE